VTIIRIAFGAIPQLERFSGLKHSQVREAFRRVDREVIAIRGQAVAAHCSQDITLPPGRNGTRVDEKTEMALLSLLLPQQRPRVSVRNMILRAGKSIQTLKPCFMMGPQAVAQYLTPGAVKFDLVIMDEASQLKPEEAIGAIARGGQLVVVGDSKQLPPTSFFSKMNQNSEDEDQYTTTDAESILNVCSSHFHPPRFLRWHYRSQHHSLIAFSNEHFYNRGLIVFPSPYGQSGRLGVRAIYLNDAVYENQSNLREAERVVDAILHHILKNPEETLGVVTLNTKQRDLIDEILDAKLRTLEQTEAVRESWTAQGQPLFVMNLESVQGEERDAIIISTTFGKMPRSSLVRQNFGPISRQGGWRRLNVLFTRARKSVSVYTSLRPEDIVVDGNTPAGTKALRNYLEFARTGSLSVSVDTGLEPDSDFEIAVLNVLQGRGYEVTPQLGVAGFRLDIAVKHPEAPGTYLAAIECDGASYHSARSVRDRDRIRQEILENLGWRGRIWRIWSTDWFRTPRQETDKLIQFLEELRRTWKPVYASGASWIEEGQVSAYTPENTIAEEAQITVSEILGDTVDDLDVQVGDLVKYSDTEKPDDVIAVRISYQPSDIPNGIISPMTPLAQTLLGAVVGDEVTLHLPGNRPRTFRILNITRHPENY
jgi:protein-L-isoaspartate O-methyltransferase/very-short-patch-repair endonuclease